MTIRTTRTGVLGAFLLTLLALFLAPPAQAGDPLTEKSAGRKYALQSKGATDKAGRSMCVSAEINDAGNQAGKLRARTPCKLDILGSWETFTLHTNDKGSHAALRSEANGLYVSAEFHDSGSHMGMLRARQSGAIGNWERFELVPRGDDGWYALKYNFTEGGKSQDYYVSAEVNSTGSDEGLLRARASAENAPGSWELFQLLQLPSSSEPPSPASTPERKINVLAWNACGNNSNCQMYDYSVDGFTDAIATRAMEAKAGVILLQEFCEKLAKPLEQKLEKKLNGGADAWDVRFAPIQYAIGKSGRWAQKSCAKNRGAYGVAIAVPAENTWYKAVELNSPEKTERRTALCAAVQSWAVMACTAHFSTGGKGYDDPERHVQQAQAAHLAEKVAEYPGYRPVFGGDLNATPTVTPEESTVPVLQPLYQKFKECDPTNTVTAGNSKLDYLFAPNTATWAPCHVGGTVGPSDHKPVWGTVTLPAR
ncbi:endonuclease/exonuclease/phosphatase family protein [Streptomyces cavourensis]|uniref:Endonuclease/exonuclease/phosphatase family protein n=1 Tax=Streptomyces cavourensis TaxID=67258 RepID=A0ABY5FE27_9ACTN|nr:endonuclease/exonuclease/phosphatase family protein [Streptomyces cavourensis]UTR81819.1 endonuclease/exonuclease/phosphatase family protein [Streptomyces cavourensis]